jgi:mRNA interferase MazF
LVIADTGDADVIVARVSSQTKQTGNDFEIEDWEKAGLLLPSIARIDKIATIQKDSVVKTLGKISDDDMVKVRYLLSDLFLKE